MHYALYRKYRPLTFSDVAGQEHVTETLKNQIKSGQFAHAYLFTGTRGTGKTSCAKILARAVNCLAPRDGEPCNECEICLGLLRDEIYDVYEIDAASNNSVDNIRQIREEIVYSPVKTKYKVYIIDEVHMLSSGAFNALLKTLEEPPSHAIFILATTEAHKVPATVLSRCQRFDMHRLSVASLSLQIKKVLEKENRRMPDDIVSLIASLADGSVRDSLSILEKVLEMDDPNEIKNVLGVCDTDTLFELSDAVCRSDVDRLYSAVSEFYSSSRDFGILCHDLLSHFRYILIAKTSSSPENLIERPKEDIDRYISAARGFTSERILQIMYCFQQTIQNLSRSPDKRADTEICLLRCSDPSLDGNIRALSARLKRLEDSLSSGAAMPSRNDVAHSIETEKFSDRKEAAARDVSVSSKKLSVPDIISPAKVVAPVKAEVQANKEVPEQQKVSESAEAMKNSGSGSVSGGFSENRANSGDNSGGDGGLREYLSLDVIASKVSSKSKPLSLILSRSCQAVYKEKLLVLLCSRSSDLDEINTPQNRQLIEEALEDDRKTGYTLRVEVGTKDRYLSTEQQKLSEKYNSIQDSNLFQF